jgi:hypothetical protein
MNKLYTAAAFLFVSSLITAQTVSRPNVFGYQPEPTECLSEPDRLAITLKLAENIKKLQQERILPTKYSESIVLFDWPLQLRTGLVDYGYHSISAQVDHDAGYPLQLEDYNCGMRTYDTQTGYNHQGTDYFLWPFDWNKMDSGDVEIIAAAAGTIIYKADGYFDRSCGSNNNPWNAVYIQHSDGSVAWYGHMKSGSTTTKIVGQTVTAGEYLGKIGSSGNSSGPHLHLEVYDPSNTLIDPYAGTCNTWNSQTWWNSQRPYVDAGINHIATNFAPPQFNACSQQHVKNERDLYIDTDTIYLMMYYRFFSTGDSTLITIYRPDNSVWGSWWDVSSYPNFNAAYLYYWAVLGSGEMPGQWKFEVQYKNQTYFHNFYLGLAGVGDDELASNIILYPNPSQGQLTVSATTLSNEGKLIIYDAVGKQVGHWSLVTGENKVDMSGLVPGIYLYEVRDGDKRSYGKLQLF